MASSAAVEGFLYGYHPVREHLRRHPQTVTEVLIAARRGGPRRVEIEGLCRRHRLTWREVPEPELRALSGAGEHNGFGARVEAAATTRGEPADPDLHVLVEDVQDPRNLGALLRVCEGAGVGQVLIRDRGSAPISPAVVKTSAGAAGWLHLERIVNTAQVVARYKREGFWVYGASAEGGPPWEQDLSGQVLLLFGGEEKGLRARSREICDALVGLPLRGRVESLNLATAAAGVLYEAVRQRLHLRSES